MVNEKKEIENRSDTTLNVFAGVLIGSLAGVILTILLARHPGMKMRHLIWQRGVNIRGRIVGTFHDLVKLTHYDNRQIPATFRAQTNFKSPKPV